MLVEHLFRSNEVQEEKKKERKGKHSIAAFVTRRHTFTQISDQTDLIVVAFIHWK